MFFFSHELPRIGHEFFINYIYRRSAAMFLCDLNRFARFPAAGCSFSEQDDVTVGTACLKN